MKLHLPALLVTCAAMLCSCERSTWYADTTEWISGLPADNFCELSEPMRFSREAGEDAPASDALVFIRAIRKKDPRTTSRLLLPAQPGDPDALPAGTQAELLRVLTEQQPDKQFALYAELRLASGGLPLWVFLGKSAKPSRLPFLVNPTTKAPLSLDLNDALESAAKWHSPR